MATNITGLAAAVRARRRELRLTQDEAAELAGVSAKFIREFERGKATVRLDKVVCLFDVLGMELRAEVTR